MNYREPSDFALLGAAPYFSNPLFVGRPNIPNKQKVLERIEQSLDSKWLSNRGPWLCEFEQAFCDFSGVKHSIAVSNATIGLEVLIKALELQGEVLVPSFTFIATAHVLQWLGIRPVFCEVDPLTHTLDPRDVLRKITARTSGILGVHLWSNPCDIKALEEIAKSHQLKLIFDAAHATGGAYQGVKIGGFGEAEVFSFHATKTLNAFEGGMITTNSDDLARVLREMINFGFVGFDQTARLGVNAKMHEASAAMGLTSLESMSLILERNFENQKLYAKAFADLESFSLYPASSEGNGQYIVVQVTDKSPLSRDQWAKVLNAEGLIVRRYFAPGCHRMEPFKTLYPEVSLPITESLSEQTLTFPTGLAIDAETIRKIKILISAVEEHAQVLVQAGVV